MTLASIISDNSITVFLETGPLSIVQDNPNFTKVREALATYPHDRESIQLLMDVKTAITSWAEGNVSIVGDEILYQGRAVHSHLTERMMKLFSEGFDITPWAKFMENLFQNPSNSAVNELYQWLEVSNMPITPDGHFLAYKKVDDDYTSFYKNRGVDTVLNALHTTVDMPRNEVDDDRDRTCSNGLHFCSYKYLPHYYSGKGRVLVLKINPKDVVSIPKDYDNAKGRASSYYIMSEIAEQNIHPDTFTSAIVN